MRTPVPSVGKSTGAAAVVNSKSLVQNIDKRASIALSHPTLGLQGFAPNDLNKSGFLWRLKSKSNEQDR